MNKAPEYHVEDLMPVKMGSPYRVPHYAYQAYGLGPHINEDRAWQAYKNEWISGTEAQNALVPQVTIAAGFGDYNGLLQQTAAKAVVITIERLSLKSPVMLDVGAGAGASGLAIAKLLPKNIREYTRMILNDPAEEKLKTAEQLIEEAGVRCQKLVGADMEVLGSLESGSVDILTGVASVHHHAGIPFDSYARVLRKGGFAIFADWHHDIWEHPARVLKFLERFEWPKKKEGLANWIAAYPQALNDPDINIQLTPEDLMARKQITRFWLAYKNIADKANLGPNAIWPLEGHRPVARYVENLQSAGFAVNSPKQLLPDSSLLMITIAQKVK